MTSWLLRARMGLRSNYPRHTNCDRGAPAETAQRIHQLLEEQRYPGRPVLLGLGSPWCLSATIPVPSSRQAKKRGTIGFLVEPHLPWSAEEAVIDYETLNDDKRIFAVSAEARPLADLVSALEEQWNPRGVDCSPRSIGPGAPF